MIGIPPLEAAEDRCRSSGGWFNKRPQNPTLYHRAALSATIVRAAVPRVARMTRSCGVQRVRKIWFSEPLVKTEIIKFSAQMFHFLPSPAWPGLARVPYHLWEWPCSSDGPIPRASEKSSFPPELKIGLRARVHFDRADGESANLFSVGRLDTRLTGAGRLQQ
ncbi:hypothetical protein RRG08_003036 [Elysia crispata]|uniref:Uncharacterized protein n=1 Tax=Elysia crispata TaxID=231223 RepID=A0AAE1B731_9GAST|nr:hypothetical protein RRG08_003036 [Elysia crispata]